MDRFKNLRTALMAQGDDKNTPVPGQELVPSDAVAAVPSDLMAELGDVEVDPFLAKQMMIESSLGRNLEHARMKSGIHKGDKAVGRYGLMPNTLVDIAKKLKTPITVLGSLEDTGANDASFAKDLLNLSKEELSQKIEEDPELETYFARKLAKEVLAKQRGDKLRATEAWQFGNNLSPKDISDERLNKSDRVRKYKNLDYDRMLAGAKKSQK